MGAKEKANTAFQRWYDSLKLYGKFPAKGTVGGALVVLDRLQQHFDLSIDSHTAKGGSQISGASGAAVRSILERFDETRPFLQEGAAQTVGYEVTLSDCWSQLKARNLKTYKR